MFKFLLFCFGIFLTQNSFSQQLVNYNKLKFKNHFAYLGENIFTGYAYLGSATYKFKNGKKDGPLKNENYTILYKDNYIEQFQLFDNNQTVIFDLTKYSKNKNITNIKPGLFVKGEKKDTLKIGSDFDIFYGIVLEYNFIQYDTLKMPNFLCINYSISFTLKGFEWGCPYKIQDTTAVLNYLKSFKEAIKIAITPDNPLINKSSINIPIKLLHINN